MIKKTILILGLIVSSIASAADLNWSGNYRAEAQTISSYDFDGTTSDFMLHHLSLSPKVIASDGVILRARFDLINNSNYTGMTNQIGGFLGNSPTADPASTGKSTTENSDVIGQTSAFETVAISEAYGTWIHEYGALVFGRVPKQHGMGLIYSAGNGNFDHWLTTHDIVGYKMIFGNMFFMPMIGKKHEGNVSNSTNDDVDELSFLLEYANPDSGLTISVLNEELKSPGAMTPASVNNGGTSTKAYRTKLWDVYVNQTKSWGKIAAEMAFLSGDTGVSRSSEFIKKDGFAIASEISWNINPKMELNTRLGIISGDDLTTNDKDESILANRNFDIALLMMNYPLGDQSKDITGSDSLGKSRNSLGLDTDYMTNVAYISPRLTYKTSDRLKMDFTYTMANLREDAISGQAGKDLGSEIDFGLSYFPQERLHLRLDIGYLLTGDAYSGDGTLSKENVYMISTKAAINF